ncbi:MAG: cadmium-translocating P-type ATPase [Acidobacteria bacterium]|nr:cadmium-translocating P-type ATPase [Acidobacteriota bacterium]
MATTCTVCVLHAESTFKIEGMDCREEVALLERRFRSLVGLEGFHADLMGQRLHVKYDASKLTASTIAAAVADAGMRAWLEHEEPLGVEDRSARTRQVLLAASAGWFAGGLIVTWLHGSHLLEAICFAASLASALPLTARKAWVALKHRSLDINVLMLIAAAGAIALGQWSEAAAVVFLFAIAQMLEAMTLERARNAVRALIDLAPTEVLLKDRSGEHRVPVDTVSPGSIIVIKPGEKLPLDGEVVAGASDVNQAPVTGESLPVDKGPGDEVFAGSINGRGALEVKVTRFRRDTTLARIIHLVEQAQGQRAPAQTFVERFARIYTPAVIALAIAIAVVPPLALGAAWDTWVYRALVLLVVSCPCALVISTPVSVVAALAGAARRGVLIKGGVHLERAGQVRCVAFDKTGTLTRGTPEVVSVYPFNGSSHDTILSLAASVEQRSEHPIAEAIIRHATDRGLAFDAGASVSALTGRGAEGRVGASAVLLGNHRLFEDRDLCFPTLHAHVEDLSSQGQTAVIVARDTEPIGVIAVADRPRETGRDALDMLRQQGIEAVVMLTGDSYGTAKVIAAELGVDDFRAELMPEDKVAAVRELREKYGSVAMVGDGVNDAPALALADVGIAMGVAGSDAALETADVALMSDDLLKIPYAFRLSRSTLRNIKTNLAISLALKAAFVVAAVTGVATLWMAILADTGASVIVVANALRLLKRS